MLSEGQGPAGGSPCYSNLPSCLKLDYSGVCRNDSARTLAGDLHSTSPGDLYIHAGLRRAVYEAETLFQDGTLEAPPRPAGAPDISLMGYTGLDFSKRCTYRQNIVRKCATKDEYAMEADQEHSERVFMFDPAEIKHQLLNNPVHVKTTWDAVQVLITSELDHEDREREDAAAQLEKDKVKVKKLTKLRSDKVPTKGSESDEEGDGAFQAVQSP